MYLSHHCNSSRLATIATCLLGLPRNAPLGSARSTSLLEEDRGFWHQSTITCIIHPHCFFLRTDPTAFPAICGIGTSATRCFNVDSTSRVKQIF